MKTFFCLIFVALVGVRALTVQDQSKRDIYSKQCKAETGVSQELIDKSRQGEFVNDSKLKEQILCVLKKLELMNQDGNLLEENIRKELTKVIDAEQEVENLMKKCVKNDDNKKETAFNVSKCLHKNIPEN